jgi:hypothetical protein
MSKFAKKLSSAQMREAREFEKAGLTTISQAVKAFERNDMARITTWRIQIDEINQQRTQTLFD